MKYLKTAQWMVIVAAAVALLSESNPCAVSSVMAAETSPVVTNTVLEWTISAQEDSNVKAVYDSTTKTLTIRGTGVSKDYSASSRPPWREEDIEKVVIEDGVTKVGNNTIYMMDSVQQVSIGASVEELGKYVLAGCSGLTSLEIPGNVKKIGDFAFINCTNLESVTLEEGMQTLGNSVFQGCSALKSITIPQSMETMGNTVFGGCIALKTATIGSGVTQVGNQPFNGCLALEEVTVDQENTHYMAEEGVLFNYTQTELIHYPGARQTVAYEIPDSVASILKRAFADCSVLEDLTLSAGVNKLSPSALIGSSIKNIYVKKENLTFSSIDGVLMNKEGSELLLYPLGRKEAEYTIPESVEVIGSDSFYNCDVLTSVIMPKGLREIKSHAFSNCDNFTSFHLPDSVEKIGISAFSFCNNLKAVNMGSNVTTIKSSAFKGRGSLKSIYVPSSVTSLEGGVFGESTIIYGEEGSAIETYAQENSLVFRSIVPIEMDFGQVEVGEAVEAKTTSWVSDTGNTYSLIEPQFHYQISMAVEPDVENGEVILSVQPKEGWTVGNYQETIVVINEEGIVHTVIKAAAEAVSPAIVYTITFEAGEGSAEVKEAQTEADGSLKELPQAEREGYELEGWYTQEEGGEQVTENTVFTGSTTVYARWKKVEEPGGDTQEKVYTITFEAGEGSAEVKEAQTEADGSLKELPQAEREGYELEGWYTQEEGGEQVTENTVFTSSTTIYARWKKLDNQGGNISEKEWPFIDVEKKPGHWKYDNIKFVYERNLMGGVGGSNLFQPDRPLSRAMFATVLYRMAGNPNITYSPKFTDVKEGIWYSNAILWVESRKIAEGYTDGSYGIDDDITREQIAKMLYLYGKDRGYNVGGRASLKEFTDAKEVNGWAMEFMQWAVDAEMITGKPNDAAGSSFRLDPKGKATRAECAKMLTMFLKKYEVVQKK